MSLAPPDYLVTFPNRHTLHLPAATAAAIAHAHAKYPEPLWLFRAERVLKLGAHQWIFPAGPDAAHALFAQHPTGLVVTAWKLFNRSWTAAAEAYWLDTARYPAHPRHLGQGVVPLVDEDADNQQIGWARIEQMTTADPNDAIFVQFTLLDLFAPRPLPAEYA